MASNDSKTTADPQAENNQPAVTELENPAAGIPHNEVASLAHKYWEERGRSIGTPDEDWFRAERALKERGENVGEG